MKSPVTEITETYPYGDDRLAGDGRELKHWSLI